MGGTGKAVLSVYIEGVGSVCTEVHRHHNAYRAYLYAVQRLLLGITTCTGTVVVRKSKVINMGPLASAGAGFDWRHSSLLGACAGAGASVRR